MPIACFLDTNVLIYAAAGKTNEPEKHAIARRLVAEAAFGLSGQVLAEFAVDVTSKLHVRLSSEEADEWLDALSDFPTAVVDAALVRRGVFFARRYQLNYFDGAILAAAERLEAPILYTEDLSHGQR